MPGVGVSHPRSEGLQEMGSGPSEGTVASKTIALDGVDFRLVVTRNEYGTTAMVEAIECRPKHPPDRGVAVVQLHSQPYDAKL